MDPRLQEASFSGDLHSLQQLLREDRLLLNRPTSYCSDTPLHVAATLGHAEFAAELLRLRPDLAFELGAGGHTPLHLAAANGHVAVVKVLLQQLMLRRRNNNNNNNNAAELCLLRDKDGLTPVHAAALKGRTDVLRDLVGACPRDESVVRAVNGLGETALHLAVRSGSFEAVEFLVERVGDGTALLNSKDDSGNTVLHLAVARKQLQTTRLMLSKLSVNVINSANLRGLTPLDVLLESPDGQYWDMALGEMIRAAGGKTAVELDKLIPPAAVRHRHRVEEEEEEDKYRNTPGTLMVVATLIATITFQAALNPPGGFNQNQDVDGKNSSSTEGASPDDIQSPGKVILGNKLDYFLIYDVIGLFSSMSIILLLISVGGPRRKGMIGLLSWIMWVAVLSTTLAFHSAIKQIYESKHVVIILAYGWFGILNVAVVWFCFRFVAFLLGRVGWWNGRQHGDGHAGGRGGGGGLLLVVKRIGVVAMVLVAVGATAVLTFMFVRTVRQVVRTNWPGK